MSNTAITIRINWCGLVTLVTLAMNNSRIEEVKLRVEVASSDGKAHGIGTVRHSQVSFEDGQRDEAEPRAETA